MSKSTLQVLVPVRGDAPFLAAALASLRAQTFGGWQATLCPLDANARDVAMRAVDGDARMQVADTVGMAEASALAHGAHADASEFLCVLDSDDTLEPAAQFELFAWRATAEVRLAVIIVAGNGVRSCLLCLLIIKVNCIQ